MNKCTTFFEHVQCKLGWPYSGGSTPETPKPAASNGLLLAISKQVGFIQPVPQPRSTSDGSALVTWGDMEFGFSW